MNGGKVGIGIIGCGYWGVNYVRVFNEMPGSQVVAVCDQRPESLARVKERWPGVETYEDVATMLQSDQVEAVVICTPATTHFEVAKACLQAQKHTLVEKPLTTCSDQASELSALASQKGLTLMVGHTFLYNTAVRKLREYVEKGDLGKIYYLYSRRTNLGPIRQDVNAIWDLATHDVAIFDYLLGSRPDWVSAVGARVIGNGQVDVGFISLGYPGGVTGHIHVSWADPNKVREVVVVGSDKRVVFDDLNALERVRVYEKGVAAASSQPSNFGERQILLRDGDIISPRIPISEPLKLQCEHFLDCAARNETPLTSGEEGVSVVQVMEAIDQSVALNGAPVKVGVTPQGISAPDGVADK